METLLYALSMLCAAVGLVGSVVRGFPSLAMSVVALVLLFFTPEPPFAVADLFIYMGIAAVATLSARFVPPVITRRWGGTKYGYCGSVVGMLAGFMLYPPLGILLSPLFGAVMGEMLNDRSDMEQTFKIGAASFGAFLVGGWIQFVVALWALWWLLRVDFYIKFLETFYE